MTGKTIAEAEGTALRFTDHQVPDAGIRRLFSTGELWQAWLDVEAALASAQAEVGLVPAAAAGRIAEVAHLDAIDRDRVTTAMREQAHPLVPLIEELTRVAGEPAGGWVHWGATSQNIMQTGYALQLRRGHKIIRDLTLRLLDALAELADRSADMIMAGRTHGQHAVPITFGLKAATWLDDLLLQLDRVDTGIQPCLRVMMGGAVGTFASLGEAGPQVQQLIADRLGLGSMPIPSRAILSPQAGYVSDLALLSAAGARIALDVETLMQTEFAEVSEPVGQGSVGSSTMPHKRNPKLCADVLDLASVVRSAAFEAVPAVIHPHEADGGATAKIDAALSRAMIAIGDQLTRLDLIIRGLELFGDRMRQNLELSGNLISSEAIMLALGEQIGRDDAHRVVYRIAMRAAGERTDFVRLLGQDELVSRHLSPDKINALIDPAGQIGISPKLARQTADRARAVLNEHAAT